LESLEILCQAKKKAKEVHGDITCGEGIQVIDKRFTIRLVPTILNFFPSVRRTHHAAAFPFSSRSSASSPSLLTVYLTLWNSIIASSFTSLYFELHQATHREGRFLSRRPAIYRINNISIAYIKRTQQIEMSR
jgi:hypothetical protein